jgi:hypothetical protein
MIEFLPWLIGLAVHGSGVQDTARLEGERLVVRPLGISFLVPPVWLGQPVPQGRNYLCGNHPGGTVNDRIVTEPSRFNSLQHPAGEWKSEFSAVVDSVLPFGSLVAHLGGDPWAGHCGTLQMRVYVGDQLGRRTANAEPGVRAASRYFKPVVRTHRHPGRWSVTRLWWEAWYYDYGGLAVVEFWSRRFRGRDVVFVFMLTGADDDQSKDRTAIIASVREQ